MKNKDTIIGYALIFSITYLYHTKLFQLHAISCTQQDQAEGTWESSCSITFVPRIPPNVPAGNAALLFLYQSEATKILNILIPRVGIETITVAFRFDVDKETEQVKSGETFILIFIILTLNNKQQGYVSSNRLLFFYIIFEDNNLRYEYSKFRIQYVFSLKFN